MTFSVMTALTAGTTGVMGYTLVTSIINGILNELDEDEIGRASCRERVQISVVAGSLKKKKIENKKSEAFMGVENRVK